ncbi:MAG: hypothetical protein DELT_01541 [Desulfovibrio sp.]
MMPSSSITAYLLAEDESALALDRKVLRRLGVTTMVFFSSGRKALDELHACVSAKQAANGPGIAPGTGTLADILIVAERLADMTGVQFLSHARASAHAAAIPALLLVSNAQSSVAVAARASSSCVVLGRPYSPEQAQEALRMAFLPENRITPMILPPSFSNTFTPRGTRQNEAPLLRRNAPAKVTTVPGERALQEGLAALQRGDLTAASTLLRGSYDADPGRVETCLAISKLYSFLHKGKEEMAWLCRAAVLCLKRNEITRAKNLLARLPRGKEGQGYLLAEAGLVLQAGEAKAAALAFLEAHRLDPSQQLHALIGRTCMFTPAPEEHMRELVRALNGSGHSATASKLNWRLLQPPKEEETSRHSFLENFPLLYDIVSVATHTFKAWRHAA